MYESNIPNSTELHIQYVLQLSKCLYHCPETCTSANSAFHKISTITLMKQKDTIKASNQVSAFTACAASNTVCLWMNIQTQKDINNKPCADPSVSAFCGSSPSCSLI